MLGGSEALARSDRTSREQLTYSQAQPGYAAKLEPTYMHMFPPCKCAFVTACLLYL